MYRDGRSTLSEDYEVHIHISIYLFLTEILLLTISNCTFILYMEKRVYDLI